MRAARAALVAAILALHLAAGPPAVRPAMAQDDDRPVLRVTLTDLTGVLGPGTARPLDLLRIDDVPLDDLVTAPTVPDLRLRAIVEHVGEEALDDLTVVVEVHPATSSRTELRRALDQARVLDGSNAIHIHQTSLRDGERLRPAEVSGFEVRVPTDDVGWDEDGGVHPVRVTVLRGATVLSETVTAVVWLAEAPADPLLTTVVWPLDTPPWRRAGGTYPSSVDHELRPGSRLDAQLRAVERAPQARVLLAPPAHLLEDLADRADGFERTERRDGGALERRTVPADNDAATGSNALLARLRNALAASPLGPLSRPYADADLAALVGSGPGRTLAGELARAGRLRLNALGGRSSDQRAYLLPARIDGEVLDLVPADTVLVPYTAIIGPDPASNPTLGSPVRDARSATGRPVTLIVGDPHLTDLLGAPAPAGSLLAAQRILVETAMVYFETPALADRALSIHPPDRWSPSTDLAVRLLRQLGNAPWLQLSDPQTLAERARRGLDAQLQVPGPELLDRDRISRLLTVDDDLTAVVAARAAAEVADVAGRDPTALHDVLLRATSRWFPVGSNDAMGLVEEVASSIGDTLADVAIASGSHVTLTSDTGTIPITLQRGAGGGPLAVRVELASQGRLTWPDGRRSETLVLDEGTTQTVTFATRALSTGSFSVSVRVTDPSGRLELDRANLSVRSTSISGSALWIIGGSVVLLLAAGLRRRRPARTLRVVR